MRTIRSGCGGVGQPTNPISLILSAIFLGPIVLFLAGRRDRTERERLWGDKRFALIALKPKTPHD